MVESKNEAYERLKEERKNFIHISFSEFSLYKNCPHQHLVLKHLSLEPDEPSIHLFFGNAVHESFEYALRDGWDLEKRVKTFRETFYKNMLDNMPNHPDFREVENFLDQGENIIRTFDVDGLLSDYEVVSVEEDLYENLHGKYHFKGFIDLVLRNKKTGRYLIIDWKTSGQAWKLEKKKEDSIFMCQMRFYKFFWARKNGISLNDIDCQYIVLNRLVNKKKHNSGFGTPQYVDINSTEEEIKSSLVMLAESVRDIHIRNFFPKVKKTNPELLFKNPGCLFCKYKGGKNPMCNSSESQYKTLLLEHKY